MSNLISPSILHTIPKPLATTRLVSDKGQQILDGMLLSQYQNSPDFKEYMMCFVAELDYLFQQIEAVYLGRFLDQAIGVQLDVVGIILQQSRAVALPTVRFGFQGAVDVDGMADEAMPSGGGLFRDEHVSGNSITPLDDATYRRVLYAIAVASNRDTADINLAYYICSILLGRIPSVFSMEDADSGTGLAKRAVELVVSRSSITSKEVALILYMSKYFVPAGITFTIRQV